MEKCVCKNCYKALFEKGNDEFYIQFILNRYESLRARDMKKFIANKMGFQIVKFGEPIKGGKEKEKSSNSNATKKYLASVSREI